MVDLSEAARQTRSWACYDCGKCTATCPLARAGAGFSPRRQVMHANQGHREELLNDGALFTCLTCSQCDQRCPAEVDFTGLVQRMREMANAEAILPQCPHGGALHALMRMMARGGTQQTRLGWLEDSLDTAPAEADLFYWTGCTPYFDAFFTDLGVETLSGTRAAVRLLNRAGTTPVVSAEERCCGHDLLWNGDRDAFEALARHNVALLEKSGAQTLVTSCAECVRTWRVDYPPLFNTKPPRILHIAEWLAEHLPELGLTNPLGARVTFQDPCRLGRHLGVYQAPRQVLAALPGLELAEMRRHGPAAVCCAGGTWSHCDRVAKSVQVNRLLEARASGAATLVTACPKCQIHLRCAMKDPNLGPRVEIELRDLADLVSEALG